MLLSMVIYGAYVVLFSPSPISRLYRRMQRWINVTLATFFAAAGLRLLRG